MRGEAHSVHGFAIIHDRQTESSEPLGNLFFWVQRCADASVELGDRRNLHAADVERDESPSLVLAPIGLEQHTRNLADVSAPSRRKQALLPVDNVLVPVRPLHDDDGVERLPTKPTGKRQRILVAHLWPLIGVVNLQFVHRHHALPAVVARLHPVIPFHFVNLLLHPDTSLFLALFCHLSSREISTAHLPAYHQRKAPDFQRQEQERIQAASYLPESSPLTAGTCLSRRGTSLQACSCRP